MSDAARRRRVEALCDAALQRAAGERSAFVAAACGNDEALRREVDALLAHAQTAEGFLAAPIGAVAANILGDASGASLVGRQIGSYRILSLLGAGGMGEVYRATDTSLGRQVAIKILPAALASDPDRVARFEREARIVAALNHPHICTLHDVGRKDGIEFLVMEYLDGDTLAEHLVKGSGRKGPPLRLEEALAIAIQIADALDTAHRAGIVHRDLKPGNIMLVRRGGPSGPPAAKLLDFGLAKATPAVVTASGLSAAPTLERPVTKQGTLLGTLQYMAPEQLEGREADTRTDIFAFGSVLYEMLTGQKAFSGKSQASLISAIMSSDPLPLATLQPHMPPALDRVVRKCLAKEPDDRWQTARDLRDELMWIAADGRMEPSERATPPGRMPRAKRERLAWRLLAATAVLALVAAAVAVVAIRRPAPELPLTRLDVVTPPTSDPFSFALSPDGRRLVYVANAEGGSKLWLRPLDQTTAQPLEGTEGATAPFWAPDGRAIGFFVDGNVKRIDLTGGSSRVLASQASTTGGAWNPDGVIVFESRTTLGLMKVTATGGTPAALLRLPNGSTSPRWPQFLPDGRRFLFFVQGTADTRGVYVGSLDGGTPTRLLASESAARYVLPGQLLLVSGGELAAYRFDEARAIITGDRVTLAQGIGVDPNGRPAVAVSAAGVLGYRNGASVRRQLAWVDRTGKTLGVVVPAEDSGLASPDLSPSGQQVGVTRNLRPNFDVWLIEAATGTARRFTFNAASDGSPVWSPDGDRLVFRSNRNGKWDLFEKPVNGATDEQPLLITPQDKSPLGWSSDGRFLLYTTLNPQTQSDLWAISFVGERKSFPVVQTSFDEVEGQFSPDGRWIAYASNESGRYEIYIRPFPAPGGTWQVSTSGGHSPRWRPDGQELFYVAPDNRLMAAPIQLTADSHTASPGTPVALFASRLTAGNTGIGGFSSRAQYAVAPDGRFLMNVNADDAAAAPITIVQNWTALLKQ